MAADVDLFDQTGFLQLLKDLADDAARTLVEMLRPYPAVLLPAVFGPQLGYADGTFHIDGSQYRSSTHMPPVRIYRRPLLEMACFNKSSPCRRLQLGKSLQTARNFGYKFTWIGFVDVSHDLSRLAALEPLRSSVEERDSRPFINLLVKRLK